MVSAKKLVKMIQQWQKITALQRKRISFTTGTCCVEKGHFAIYTADERRFVVPLAYLNSPVFRQLLEMSEEEYGLGRNGPIVLPCDSVLMDYAICLIRKGGAGDLQEGVIKYVARRRCSTSCLYEGRMHQGQFLVH